MPADEPRQCVQVEGWQDERVGMQCFLSFMHDMHDDTQIESDFIFYFWSKLRENWRASEPSGKKYE
jgi:hypothetical protein